MPNKWTFHVECIRAMILGHLAGRTDVIDPFCGTSRLARHSNDLADSGLTANEYLDNLIEEKGEHWADGALLDPPYSPRQISECYESIGRECSTDDTQNAALYSEAIERLSVLLKPGAVAIRCGWNSNGFGKTRGFAMREILMVAHGGAHNDTIVTVEVYVPDPSLFS